MAVAIAHDDEGARLGCGDLRVAGVGHDHYRRFQKRQSSAIIYEISSAVYAEYWS
jgi:hypothetical protein